MAINAAGTKRFSKKAKIGIATGAVAALLLTAGGLTYSLTAGSRTYVPSSDVVTVSKQDLVSKVSTTGTVAPLKEVSLYTHLTGPVTSVGAKVGDRVNTSQVLANIDTSALQKELDSQRATQQATAVANANQVESAQLQLSQYRDALDQGLNPEVNAAQSTLRAAKATFDDSLATFEAKKKAIDTGSDPALTDLGNGVTTAREQVRAAGIDSIRTAFGLLSPTEDPGGMAVAAVNAAESDVKLSQSKDALDRAERAYNDGLARANTELATSQRQVSNNFAALAEAERGAEAASLAAQQQLQVRNQAAEQAIRTANSGDSSAESANARLQLDIDSSEVRTPIPGVVTAVEAAPGKPAAGSLLTVADDSTLLVKASVKEADLGKVKVGDEVTFTSPSAGTKEFKGKISSISPVAADAGATGEAGSAQGGEKQSSATKKATFPVEVTVTSDAAGLRMGSTVKSTIIVDKQPGVVAVARDAVFEDSGSHYVRVLTDGNVVEKRKVELGRDNELQVALASGVKDGEKVLTQAAKYRGYEGKSVSLVDDKPSAK